MTDIPGIDWYLDQAREAFGAKSDRELSGALGLSPGAVSQYRTKRAWPDDEVMQRLARRIHVTEDVALTHLNYWRAPSPAKIIYQSIANKLALLASIFILSITFGAAAFAKEPSANRVTSNARTVYIMANRVVRVLLKHLATISYNSCEKFFGILSRS